MASAIIKKWMKSDEDLKILRRQYKKNDYPNAVVKLRLANKFKVTPDQVANWFRTERLREDNGPRSNGIQNTQRKAQDDSLKPQRNHVPHASDLGDGAKSKAIEKLSGLEENPPIANPFDIHGEGNLQIKTENGFVGVKSKPLILQSMIARKRAKRDGIYLRINAYAKDIGRSRTERMRLEEKIAKLLDAERQAEAGSKLAQEELEDINLDLRDIGA